jgi:hypothetical protein
MGLEGVKEERSDDAVLSDAFKTDRKRWVD